MHLMPADPPIMWRGHHTVTADVAAAIADTGPVTVARGVALFITAAAELDVTGVDPDVDDTAALLIALSHQEGPTPWDARDAILGTGAAASQTGLHLIAHLARFAPDDYRANILACLAAVAYINGADDIVTCALRDTNTTLAQLVRLGATAGVPRREIRAVFYEAFTEIIANA